MAQNINLPSINAPLVAALPVAQVDEKVTTFIGQMLATGTAIKETLLEVAVGTENTLFGRGSMLATMIAEFRKVNEVSTVQAVAYADADLVGGVANTIDIQITGAATANGTIKCYIGNDDRVYQISVAAADTANAIAAALAAVITTTLDPDALVDTAAIAVDTITLTARNQGVDGNTLGVRLAYGVTGVTATITNNGIGASKPVLTGIANIISERSDVVAPYSYDLTDAAGLKAVKTMLDDRFNYNNKIMDGRLITAVTAASATAATALDAQNSASITVFVDKPVAITSSKVGSAIFATEYQKAAQFAGIRALRTNSGAMITDYVLTLAPQDQRGGPHTNSLPFHNTPTSFTPIPVGEGFTPAEVAVITASGGSVMGNNSARNTVICGAVYTTYKTNAQGVADTSYEYLTYVDTSTASREYIVNALRIDYGQKRLTQGAPVVGYAFASSQEVKTNMLKYYLILAGSGYCLLQSGVMDNGVDIAAVFNRYLTVTLDTSIGEINIEGILPIMSQVRSIYCPLSIVFSPENI